MVLKLVARPSASVRSSVNASPLVCGSIRIVKLLGRVSPAKVDRAAFSFQVPYAAPAQQAALSGIRRRTVRMKTQCAPAASRTSLKVSEGCLIHLHLNENWEYSRNHAHGGIRCRSRP